MKKPLPPIKRDPARFGCPKQWNESVQRSFEDLPRCKGQKPAPCDCGYWEPDEYFCYCTPKCRAGHTVERVQDRIASTMKVEADRVVRNRRKWSGEEPHKDAAKGHCTWCGDPIMLPDGLRMNLRRKRHEDCSLIFLSHIFPSTMRRYVFRRDGGKCAACGVVHSSVYGEWDADHIKMLALANGDGSFWHPDNVRILCRDPCHKAKSAQDAAELAAHRAANKKGPR